MAKKEKKSGEEPKKKAKLKKEKGESVLELLARVRDLDRELFQLRNELAMHRKLEKPHLLKQRRKEKARILTMLTQKNKSAVSS